MPTLCAPCPGNKNTSFTPDLARGDPTADAAVAVSTGSVQRDTVAPPRGAAAEGDEPDARARLDRPARTTSSSVIGIDADDVLP